MMRGLSMRDYKLVLQQFMDAYLRICALRIDGTIFKGQHLVAAVGIDA